MAKKLLGFALAFTLAVADTTFAAEPPTGTVRLGKVGEMHVYRVGGVVLGLAEGGMIGDCVVLRNGLDCGGRPFSLSAELETRASACQDEKGALGAELAKKREELAGLARDLDAARQAASSGQECLTSRGKEHKKLARCEVSLSDAEEASKRERKARKEAEQSVKKLLKANAPKDEEIARLKEGKCYGPLASPGDRRAGDSASRTPYAAEWSDLVYIPCDSCVKPPSTLEPARNDDAQVGLPPTAAPPATVPLPASAEQETPPPRAGGGLKFDHWTAAVPEEKITKKPPVTAGEIPAGVADPGADDAIEVVPPPKAPAGKGRDRGRQPEERLAVVHFAPGSGNNIVAGENSLLDALSKIRKAGKGKTKVRVVGYACAADGQRIAKERADMIVGNLARNEIRAEQTGTMVEKCTMPKENLAVSRAEVLVTWR